MPQLQPTPLPPDNVGAFMRGERAVFEPTGRGPLDGLNCAVKDNIDLAGLPTGYGNPKWQSTHDVPAQHAFAVQRVLEAGARVVGKTLSDELAFSLAGNNYHYGSPVNMAAPDRLTGGSSCGSAAAVAANLCDLALGTDTGGSVRAPASFCGIYGFRPTHDAVPARGVCHLAPSFDTVGWLSRDARILEAAGSVLLPEDSRTLKPGEYVSFDSAWDMLAGDAQQGLPGLLARLPEKRGSLELDMATLDRWFEAFRIIQFHEAWAELGAWLLAAQPTLGPDVKARLVAASKIGPDELSAARTVRRDVRSRFDALLCDGAVLAMPTVPGPAPLRLSDAAAIDFHRRAAMRLLCIASLAGLPQVSMPALTASGAPLGVSFVGARGTDRQLLGLATAFTHP